MHEDGSLSLNELLDHAETARKIRAMYRDGYQALNQIDVAAVPASLRGKNNTIRFLMPLAHVVCDANKSRAVIGFLTQDNFEPGKIPEPDTWFKPTDFGDDQARQQQANDLDGKGARGGRNHVHFALDSLLASMTDALRPESDCILIARPGAVADLSPVITESRYVLTSQTVPFNRFCGVCP